jgi:hypothetical protein
MAGFTSSGHKYVAMTNLEVENIIRTTLAINPLNDRKHLGIHCEKVIAA